MVAPPPGLVRAKLAQGGIYVTLEWTAACLVWLTEQQPGLDRERALLAVQEQWLATDISQPGVAERPVLPPALASSRLVELPGTYILMVEYGLDIGSPAYGQLQKLHAVDTGNAREGEGEEGEATQPGYQATQAGRVQAAWEPRPSRALYLTLTDGLQSVRALELEPLPQLADWPRPGSKVRLKGPLTARRGVIMVRGPAQLEVLGGEAEELVERHGARALLEARIGRQEVGQTNRFAEAGSLRQPQQQQQQDDFPEDQFPDDPQVFPNHGEQFGDGNMADFPDEHMGFPDDGEAFPEQDPVPSSNGTVQDSFPEDDDFDEADLVLAASQVESQAPARPWAPPFRSAARPELAVAPAPRPGATAAPSRAPADPRPRPPLLSDTFNSPEPPSQPAPARQQRWEEAEASHRAAAQAVAAEPWTYLALLLPRIRAGEALTAKVKVVSATLASKISMKQRPGGPVWQLSILINDGSGSLAAPLAPALLEEALGPPAEYTRPGADRAAFKEASRRLSGRLAGLSAVLTLRAEGGDTQQAATIVRMEELSGLHLAMMRRRRINP